MDDRANEGVRSHSFFDVLWINQTGRKLNWKISDVKAHVFKSPTTVQNALVVYLSRDDMLLLVSVEQGSSFEAQVVALSGSRGEDDFLGLSTDHVGNVLSSIFTGLLRFPTELMGLAVRIAVVVCEKWKHGVQDTRIHGRRRLIVQINWHRVLFRRDLEVDLCHRLANELTYTVHL